MRDQVYFIRPKDALGPVKIGVSAAPGTRRSNLQAHSPYDLEIVATIEGDFVLERRFHALFRDDHTNREWFNWSPALESVISQINDGSFNPETLPTPKSLPMKSPRGPRPPLPPCITTIKDGQVSKKRLRFIPLSALGEKAAA